MADSDRDELRSRELGNFMAFEICIGHFPWYVDKLFLFAEILKVSEHVQKINSRDLYSL